MKPKVNQNIHYNITNANRNTESGKATKHKRLERKKYYTTNDSY